MLMKPLAVAAIVLSSLTRGRTPGLEQSKKYGSPDRGIAFIVLGLEPRRRGGAGFRPAVAVIERVGAVPTPRYTRIFATFSQVQFRFSC